MSIIDVFLGECPYCNQPSGDDSPLETVYKCFSSGSIGDLSGNIIKCPKCWKKYFVDGTYKVSVEFKKHKIEGQS